MSVWIMASVVLPWQRDRCLPASLAARVLLAILAALHLPACAVYGPDSMRASRLVYNQAIHQSEQRELLLNLVRLRYLETPEFLAISGISTQMSLEGVVGLGGSIGRDGGERVALATPGVSVGYGERPTITFTPQRDQAFTRQLIAPIEIDRLFLLSRQGWGMGRVMRLIAEDLNGVSNVISDRSLSGTRLRLEEFARLTDVLDDLEKRGLVRIALEYRQHAVSLPIPSTSVSPQQIADTQAAGLELEVQSDNASYVLMRARPHYVLKIDEPARRNAALAEVWTLLGIRDGTSSVEIDPGGGSTRVTPDALSITTRSVLGTLAYLSAGVTIPEEHADLAGSVTQGTVSAIRGLLKVDVSRESVEGALINVPFRDHWFYVSDADRESKRTLGLLTSLIRLSIEAGGAGSVPLLTLPVSR